MIPRIIPCLHDLVPTVVQEKVHHIQVSQSHGDVEWRESLVVDDVVAATGFGCVARWRLVEEA